MSRKVNVKDIEKVLKKPFKNNEEFLEYHNYKIKHSLSNRKVRTPEEWKDHAQLPAINIRDYKDNSQHRMMMGYFKHMAYTGNKTQAEMLFTVVKFYHDNYIKGSK